MLTTRTPSAGAFSRLSIPLVLVLLALAAASVALPGFNARAAQQDKKNQPTTTGRIEVSTNPGGYPITIDGKPAGETTDTVRNIELEPGAHTVEIQFPNSTRWSQVFQIVAGRKNCIALNYRPQTIEVPLHGQPGGKVEIVDPAKVEAVKPGATSSTDARRLPTNTFQPPTVTLDADTHVVTLCPRADAAANSRARLKANGVSPDGKPLRYKWNVSGGRLEGEGADVIWDLSDEQPGVYNAAVTVESGPVDNPLCTAFTSTKVVVRNCPPASSQTGGVVETVDLGDVTGTVCDCGEIPAIRAIPEGGLYTEPAPASASKPTPAPKPKGKKKP